MLTERSNIKKKKKKKGDNISLWEHFSCWTFSVFIYIERNS
jgi:hypothetical protein